MLPPRVTSTTAPTAGRMPPAGSAVVEVTLGGSIDRERFTPMPVRAEG